jgi:homoserine/homoserine lactone efflux protein
MFPSDYLIFLQIIIFMFITPGTPRIVIISHTLNYGLRKSVWVALGDISANFIQAVLVVFVIGSLLKDNYEILNYLKWASILYLIYLAYDTYNSKVKSVETSNQKVKSTFSFYRDGFLVAGLSPKAIVFFVTIFTSFINFETNYIAQFIILISTYVILDFSSLIMYGLLAKKAAGWLKANPKTINTISACVLLLLAIYLALRLNF